MRFIIPSVGFETELLENKVTVISIDNKPLFTKCIYDLWLQSKGELGECILSNNEEIITFSKSVSLIMNIFDIDVNNKKILTRVYKELTENATDYFSDSFSEIQKNIVNTMDKLIESVPYSLVYEDSMDISALLKLVNMRLNQVEGDPLALFFDYIQLESKICNINTYIVVNIKDYFSEEELKEFYKFLFYNKINLIIIESHQSALFPEEKNWIIDEDNCIIEVN